MLFVPLATAVAMLAFGLAALRLNPRRPTNRVLAAVCFVSVVLFVAQVVARHLGHRYAFDHVSNPMPWVRVRFACIGLLCPFLVWACYHVVSGRYAGTRQLAWKLAPWAVLSAGLVVISFRGFQIQ